MARTAQLRYFKPTVLSGSVYQLTTTAGSTANNATIARYAAAGTTTNRRFVPVAVATAEQPVPSVGQAPGNQGWRDNVAENANDLVRYALASTFSIRLRYRRSGQTLEVDQQATLTAILYIVTSTGTNVGEVGRGSAAGLTFTTAAQTVTLTTGAIGTLDLAANNRIQVEVYVGTTLVGTAAAPTVATDLWLTIDETEANSGAKVNAPAYDILYARATSDTAPATDALLRAATMARPLDESAPATDALIRRLSFPRALADAAPAADALVRAFSGARSVADTAPATDALLRAATMARAIPNAAPAVDTLARAWTGARPLAESAPAGDALTRTISFPRAIANSAPATDALVRSWTGSRSLAESASATDGLGRIVTYGRFLDEEIGTTAVDNVRTVGRRLSGVVRNSAGVAVSGATVKLVRQVDDRVVRTTTSAADGTYAFDRDIFDTAIYYVVSYIAGSPERHGVTDRGLVPVLL